MFDFQNSVFSKPKIPEDAQIVFVSDMFVEDYVGGAELTSEALITSSPFKVHKLHSREVTQELLQNGTDKFWIFGNFTQLNSQLIPSIVGNLRYSILEYDYKYCRYRSPEKHQESTKTPCDCPEQINGKLVSAFFHGAMSLWWMSESQQEHYLQKFPFLQTNYNHVLSSVFDDRTLVTLKVLREATTTKSGWIVLGSNSWVKGAQAAEQWCKDAGVQYEVVWNLPYEELLKKLASAEGFVYLPQGMDTCPRMVIEAKLLGCKLELNDNVQHKDEEWFNASVEDIEGYLYASRKLFWDDIKTSMDYRPKISGYTTTYNCVNQGYPFEECIKSMLEFCAEVCVVDGGSTDGTWERLIDLVMESKGITLASLSDDERVNTIELCKAGAGTPEGRIRIKQHVRNWNDPRFAVFDGLQKAEARKMCVNEFCWQMDSDEIVHEQDAPKVLELARAMPKDSLLLALPVIEYWGSSDKIRVDVMPWKWRLSRNDSNVTHGVPGQLRIQVSDENSIVPYVASPGTDGCDMIFADTLQPVPFVTFYNDQIETMRRMAMIGDARALQQYSAWFNAVIASLPGVFHYSWFDLTRKIKLYRGYWTRHWNSLYGGELTDTADNNMMFDVPWSEVTDEMIEQLASNLKNIGGWIWHRKWDGKAVTPHMQVQRTQPKIMLK